MHNRVVTVTDGRRAFIAALLLALAAVLIPALIHSGLPASRAIGSAFDPSTSVVAVRARASRAVSFEAAEPSRRPAAPSWSQPVSVMALAAVASTLNAERGRSSAQPPFFPLTRTGLRLFGDAALPRAPPVTSPR